jgi:hypothetical protein
MKPVKTKDTQGVFANDMPYRYVRTSNGAAIVVTWKASFLERLKILFTGCITVKTYNRTQPPMYVSAGVD